MSPRPPVCDAALQSCGVDPTDEGVHPFPPGLPQWQESVFYDWIDAGGQVAGHCRIGLHPEEGRVWFWLFLTDGENWWAIEAPRLPLSQMDTERWHMCHHGLHFERTVGTPLRSNGLQVSGAARAISGPRAGQLAPIRVDLSFEAVAAPHTMGAREEVDGTGQVRSAARFEQPMTVAGVVEVGTQAFVIAGWGERDHSWGSRHWAFLDWTFLILHSDRLRMQCAEVHFGGAHFVLGFVLEDALEPIEEACLELQLTAALAPGEVGRVSVPRPGRAPFEGRVETLGVVAIDIDHVYPAADFPRPVHSVYRRALVRVHPTDGGAPLLGWLEWCRRPRWLDHEL